MSDGTPELDRLVHAHLDGTITEEEAAELRRRLLADDGSLDRFIVMTDMHSALVGLRARAPSLERPDGPARVPVAVRRRGAVVRLAAAAACAALAAGLLWMMLRRGGPEEGETIGAFAEVRRAVYVERDGEVSVAGPGTPVMSGDTVSTRGDAGAELVYGQDGSRVQLLADTDASFVSEDGAQRVALAGGTISCSITPQPAHRELVVTTPQTSVAVKGTRFSLTAEGGRTVLKVTEGAVRLTRVADGGSIDVVAGHGALVAPDADLATHPLTEDEALHIKTFGRGMVVTDPAGDTPEQAALRRKLAGKGRLYVPSWSSLYSIRPDGSGLRLLRDFGKWRQITWVRPSWDGRYLALAVNLPPRLGGPGQELWLMRHDGSDGRAIFRDTDATARDKCLFPAWAPEDRWIVISRGPVVDAVNRDTGEVMRIAEAAAGGITQLNSDRHGNFFFWPDGLTPRANGFAVDADGRLTRVLSIVCGGLNSDPAISPDGTALARFAYRGQWPAKPARTQVRKLIRGKWREWNFVPVEEPLEAPQRGGHQNPFWSPDSRYIGFRFDVGRDEIASAGFKSTLEICRMEGGPAVRILSDDTTRFGQAAWGPVPDAGKDD